MGIIYLLDTHICLLFAYCLNIVSAQRVVLLGMHIIGLSYNNNNLCKINAQNHRYTTHISNFSETPERSIWVGLFNCACVSFFVRFNIVDLYQLNTWLTPQRIFSATSMLQSKHIGSIYARTNTLYDCCCCLFSSRRMFEIKQTILLSIADFSNQIQASTNDERWFLSIQHRWLGVFTFCFLFSQGTKHTIRITRSHTLKRANKPKAYTCSQWLTSWVWKFKCLSHFSFPSLDCCCVWVRWIVTEP